MAEIKSDEIVALDACDEYDVEKIYDVLKRQFNNCKIDVSSFVGKKVVIKPNLVMKKDPEDAATAHPAVIEALCRILNENGIVPVCAESSGGPYLAERMSAIYKTCGLSRLADENKLVLNFDMSDESIGFPGGKTSKVFHVIKPICDADVIFSVSKLKSHSLTKMSGAVKNFYGVIPGLEKFEIHARFPEMKDFSSMLCDLCQMLHENKTVINIVDAIFGMEGNGPTGGEKRKIGALITSKNAFCADEVAMELIGFSPVMTVSESKKRAFCRDIENTNVIGCKTDDLKLSDFKLADASSGGFLKALPHILGGRLNRIFEPKPALIPDKCVGCGECARSCPKKTIEMVKKGSKRVPHFNYENCIRCYCCQELCPHTAIKIRRNLVLRIIK